MSRIEKFKNLPTRGSKEVAGSRLLLRAEKDTVQVTIRGLTSRPQKEILGPWHYETSLGRRNTVQTHCRCSNPILSPIQFNLGYNLG